IDPNCPKRLLPTARSYPACFAAVRGCAWNALIRPGGDLYYPFLPGICSHFLVVLCTLGCPDHECAGRAPRTVTVINWSGAQKIEWAYFLSRSDHSFANRGVRCTRFA